MCTGQITSNALKEPERISGYMDKPDSVRKNFFLVRKKFYSAKLCHKKKNPKNLSSSESKVMRIKEVWIQHI